MRQLVVRDACADGTATYHDSNLRGREAKCADIIDAANVLARFTGAETKLGGPSVRAVGAELIAFS